MFFGCSSLKNLKLPSNGKNIENVSMLFRYCESLEYIDINKLDLQNVTDTSEMFVGCKSLKKLIYQT